MVEWKCPRCGAGNGERHGGLGNSVELREECNEHGTEPCEGLVCDCEDPMSDRDDHGSMRNPCLDAECYHCGWRGEIPDKPRKLTGWKKKAWDAGWRPTPASSDY